MQFLQNSFKGFHFLKDNTTVFLGFHHQVDSENLSNHKLYVKETKLTVINFSRKKIEIIHALLYLQSNQYKWKLYIYEQDKYAVHDVRLHKLI